MRYTRFMRMVVVILCFGAVWLGFSGNIFGGGRGPAPVSSLPQWNDFSARQDLSLVALAHCEQDEMRCASPEVKRWANLIDQLRPQNKLRQIITVNKWFNRLPYKYDEYAYDQLDYWADTQALLINRGDCEDYALSKYYTLRQLGFSAEELKVTVVYDKQNFTNHAVLMIYTNGTRYMMDINSDATEPSALGTRYKPLYSFNEKTAWFY
jgi:predicted transglutaminase-like cysteine proteinase